MSESTGLFGWERRALGASSDLDRNELVLGGHPSTTVRPERGVAEARSVHACHGP